MLLFATLNPRGLFLRFAGEDLFCFKPFCFVKVTGLLSMHLPTAHSYVINFLPKLEWICLRYCYQFCCLVLFCLTFPKKGESV